MIYPHRPACAADGELLAQLGRHSRRKLRRQGVMTARHQRRSLRLYRRRVEAGA